MSRAKRKASSRIKREAKKRRPKSVLPQELIFRQGKAAEAGEEFGPKRIKSGIFKEGIDPLSLDERFKRIGLVKPTSGLHRFKDTTPYLPTAQLNSAFAMPNLGNPGDFPVDFRGLRVEEQRGIKASVASIEANGYQVGGLGGTGGVSFQQPFYHTPGNAQDAFNLPKSYIEQIRWSRLMYNLNGWLGALTDLKAYYALSRFSLSTPEPFVTAFQTSETYNKNFNLYEFILRLSLSKQKFGEAPVWGARQIKGRWARTGKPIIGWSHMLLLEPELIEIKRDYFGSSKPRIYLRPSRDLEDLVRRMDAGDPEVKPYSDRIPEQFKQRIRNRELVPLDPSTSSILQNLTDASATRGTPPMQRLMNTFVFEDYIRLADMSRAQRYHFPFEMWSVGDLERGIKPEQADLDLFEQKVSAAIQNFPASLFVPPIIKYEALGAGTVAMSTKDDWDYIWKVYTVGLGVSEQILLGEALSLDTPIPTPGGWTTMGELKVGDELFSRDGSVTKVKALSEVWRDRPTYSFKTNAAEALICDENHKWVVRYKRVKGKVGNQTTYYDEKVLLTKQIGGATGCRGLATYSVPMHMALDLPEVNLGVPPYTLGAWLGDGTSESGGFTCHDSDKSIVGFIEEDGFKVSKQKGRCAWGIVGLKVKLRSLGVLRNKHIPKEYLRASFRQRLALLHGLMDTDGSCSAAMQQCTFDNTNYGLVSSVRELLLTLGFKPSSICEWEPKSYERLSGHKAQTIFRVQFTRGVGQPTPFKLLRKLNRAVRKEVAVHTSSRQTHRVIESVGITASVPTRCIQVEHPSGTFLAGRDFVVTHNSSIFSSTETSSNQAFIRARKTERDSIEEWCRWEYYEPLSRWNNLLVKKGESLEPIVPDIEWEKVLDYEAETRDIENRKYLYEKGAYPTERLQRKLTKENPEELGLETKQEINGIWDNGKRIVAPYIREQLAKGQPADQSKENLETASESPGSPVPGEGEDIGKGGAGGGGAPIPKAETAPAVPEAETEAGGEAPAAAPEAATAKLL